MTRATFVDEDGIRSAEWTVDFGTSDVEVATDVLVRALGGVAADARIDVTRLVVAERIID